MYGKLDWCWLSCNGKTEVICAAKTAIVLVHVDIWVVIARWGMATCDMQYPVVIFEVIETHANMRKDHLEISTDVVLSLLFWRTAIWWHDSIADIMHNDVIRYLTIWLRFWALKLTTRFTLCPTSQLHPHSAHLRDVVHAAVTLSRSGRQASHPWGREQETGVERWSWGRLVAIDYSISDIFESFVSVGIDEMKYF